MSKSTNKSAHWQKKSFKKCHEYVNIYGPSANERRVGAFLGDSAQMFD